MFVDRVRIFARAGHGGRGGLSFLREKGKPNGGPDGGHGGRGGDVILVVDDQSNNLVTLKYSPHQFAENGQSGMNKNMTGRNGKDCIISIPPGTVVTRMPFDAEAAKVTGTELALHVDESSEPEVIADLTRAGEKFVLCTGGIGGRGNMAFKSSANQAPRRYEEGREGQAGQYRLELKSIADAGLVGYPNAGKSTIISKLSNAHPKIAPYPFTTLTPVIGVMECQDYQRITVADIPGLIEGAHAGVGLGHEFLRHIERCRLLLFVIDMAGTDGRDPRDDFAQLRKEVKLYQESLAERPFLVIANKMDQPEAVKNLPLFKKKVRHPVWPIAADTGLGLAELKAELVRLLPQGEAVLPTPAIP